MIMERLANIYRLGVKELWSLWRYPIMLFLIVWTFTFNVIWPQVLALVIIGIVFFVVTLIHFRKSVSQMA